MSADGHFIISGHRDGNIRVWVVPSADQRGKPVARPEGIYPHDLRSGHLGTAESWVTQIACTPNPADPGGFVSTAFDDSVIKWALTGNCEGRNNRRRGESNNTTSAGKSSLGHRTDVEVTGAPDSLRNYVTSLTISPDGSLVCVAGNKNNQGESVLMLYDYNEKKKLRAMIPQDPAVDWDIYCVVYSPTRCVGQLYPISLA